MPRLAFFAARDIEADQELTFDYQMYNEGDSSASEPVRSADLTPLQSCSLQAVAVRVAV